MRSSGSPWANASNTASPKRPKGGVHGSPGSRMSEAILTRWQSANTPSRAAIEAIFRNDGLSASWWSNGAGYRYSAHSHSYHKVLYCARGSIRFVLEDTGEAIDLSPGDRLDLPPFTRHSAFVGPEGVACAEAARR